MKDQTVNICEIGFATHVICDWGTKFTLVNTKVLLQNMGWEWSLYY